MGLFYVVVVKIARARPGFKPRTSRTQSKNRTPRPLLDYELTCI